MQRFVLPGDTYVKKVVVSQVYEGLKLQFVGMRKAYA